MGIEDVPGSHCLFHHYISYVFFAFSASFAFL